MSCYHQGEEQVSLGTVEFYRKHGVPRAIKKSNHLIQTVAACGNLNLMFMLAGLSLRSFAGLFLILPLLAAGAVWDTPVVRAQAGTVIRDQAPGLLRGIGNDFQITESDYVDVGIYSSELISLYAESAGGVLMLIVEAATEADSTTVRLSNLAPEHSYYQYLDDFHNASTFATDENGECEFIVDLAEPHVIFIQEHKGTYYITDDAIGGSCSEIGIWEDANKTCTLTGDITSTSEVIQFDADDVTLDGAGHTFSGYNLYVRQRNNVAIRNLNLTNTSASSVFLYRSNNNLLENLVISKERGNGMLLSMSHDNHIQDNEVTITGSGTAIYLGGSYRNLVEDNNVVSDRQGVAIDGDDNTVRGNTIAGYSEVNPYVGNVYAGGVYISYRNDNVIYGNQFINNGEQAQVRGTSAGNLFSLDPPIGGNYWDDFDSAEEGCVDGNDDGFCDAPYVFTGGQDDWPLAQAIAGISDGPSNVLFLPGFQGSRLYRPGALGEDELWVPTTNQDAEQLMLDDSGQPLDPNIYTRDIIDHTKFFFPIYEGFIEFMDNDMVGAGVINEWRAFSYDWRLAASDIAALPGLSQTVDELAASSASGKVTIVAHSNGGLIAKLLLNDPGVAAQVDKLIMVATPQLGTPETLTALLHGDGQNLLGGFLVRKSTARELGENMPGAYGLLPSEIYFNTVADPVIKFTDEVKNNYDFRSLYGEAIDSFDELYSFLAGDNGVRVEPAEDDTDAPNVLNGLLLNQARDLHDNSLDNWTPPEGVEVIQIAGWGLDTVYAIEYDDCDFCPLGQDLSNLDRDIEKTIDGDGTVVITSALTENFKKYFLNILEFNKDNFINRDHKNILEIGPIQDFLARVLTSDLSVLPSYISETEPPVVPGDTRYRLRVKSPVAVHVYDSDDHHVGLIDNPNSDSNLKIYEEEIPNSSYFELGEKKYISLDGNDTYAIKLYGEGAGTFSFEIDEVEGDEVIETVAYSNIPVTPQLSGGLVLDPESLSQPELSLDLNGDGENDAVVPANGSLSPEASLELLRQAVSDTEAHRVVKAAMLLRVGLVERFIERGRAKVADVMLRNLAQFIEHMTDRRHGIIQEEALPLREMIAAIRETL